MKLGKITGLSLHQHAPADLFATWPKMTPWQQAGSAAAMELLWNEEASVVGNHDERNEDAFDQCDKWLEVFSACMDQVRKETRR